MKVLLVDDDKICAMGAKYMLEQAGCEVDVVNMAEDGLAMLNARSYDLCVTDMDLPDLHGTELAASGFLIKKNPFMPFMGLTGNSEYVNRFHEGDLKQYELDLVLEKPLNKAAAQLMVRFGGALSELRSLRH